MKILLVSQVFHPEDFKCNDLAFELSRQGHQVTVLAAIPNYPRGKFFDGYGVFRRRHEVVNGVEVIRVLVVPRGKGGALRLSLNYLSFAFFSLFIALWLALSRRFDMVMVHQVSPVTMGIPAVVVKKIQRIPMYFWVLDLWPESLTAGGGITNKYVLGAFGALTRWFYRNSKRILISSRGFRDSISAMGDFDERMEYFPNWVDKDFDKASNESIPQLPQGFIVMFAGNIGEAQNFEALMRSAVLLRERRDVHFVFVGDGRKRAWVEEEIAREGLADTVHCLGRYPLNTMPKFFAAANLLLVSLKDEPIFRLTAPAKIQAYMSSGRPIVAMMNGEGRRLVEEAQCGFAVAADDADALAATICRAADMSAEELNAMGLRGQVYCAKHFTLEQRMTQLYQMFEQDNLL